MYVTDQRELDVSDDGVAGSSLTLEHSALRLSVLEQRPAPHFPRPQGPGLLPNFDHPNKTNQAASHPLSGT